MTEIRRAKKVEREENRRKLFPIRLVDFETIRNWVPTRNSPPIPSAPQKIRGRCFSGVDKDFSRFELHAGTCRRSGRIAFTRTH